MKKILTGFLVILVFFIIVSTIHKLKKNGDAGEQALSSGGQIKTPHFIDSTPMNGEIYVARPINVTINFNFDLAGGSQISVKSDDDSEWTEGEAQIEDNSTALKKKLKENVPDGDYVVSYKACWVDKSCHDGRFSFKIGATGKSEYKDMRGQQEVTINMDNFSFNESKVIISPKTKVTWVNVDDVGHFVNTETHPEHTYYPEQNSREIASGEVFSTVFVEQGQYNYHCSAHVPEGMVASIIVSD